MRDGGYAQPQLWLSEGWAVVQREQWCRPLYWAESLEHEFTLSGPRAINPHAPVCHLSYYEADAFARWAHARLPSEAEWEVAACTAAPELQGSFLEHGNLQPVPAAATPGCSPAEPLAQMFGDVWEWTQSAYAPYPGFKPLAGALGEYNGKFMVNQLVLRGGSCATPAAHIRPSYRNFFPPAARWQFSRPAPGAGRVTQGNDSMLRHSSLRARQAVRGEADWELVTDVLRGLRSSPKRLSPMYFYDERGSQLFERICAQPEYYVTRTETAILAAHAPQIASVIGEDTLLVELGSGASTKTRLLLDRLAGPRARTCRSTSRAATSSRRHDASQTLIRNSRCSRYARTSRNRSHCPTSGAKARV